MLSDAELGSLLVDINAAIQEKPFDDHDTTPYTLEGLAKATNYSISDVEEGLRIFEKYRCIKREQGSIILTSVLSMERLPEHIWLLMGRAAYPEPPTNEEKIKVYLLLNNATADNPIFVPESEAISELHRKGQIERIDSGHYLTKFGRMMAEEILKLMPEMKSTDGRS